MIYSPLEQFSIICLIPFRLGFFDVFFKVFLFILVLLCLLNTASIVVRHFYWYDWYLRHYYCHSSLLYFLSVVSLIFTLPLGTFRLYLICYKDLTFFDLCILLIAVFAVFFGLQIFTSKKKAFIYFLVVFRFFLISFFYYDLWSSIFSVKAFVCVETIETSNEKRIGFVASSPYESEIKASRILRQDGYNLTYLVNSIFQFNSYIDLLEEEKIKAITKLKENFPKEKHLDMEKIFEFCYSHSKLKAEIRFLYDFLAANDSASNTLYFNTGIKSDGLALFLKNSTKNSALFNQNSLGGVICNYNEGQPYKGFSIQNGVLLNKVIASHLGKEVSLIEPPSTFSINIPRYTVHPFTIKAEILSSKELNDMRFSDSYSTSWHLSDKYLNLAVWIPYFSFELNYMNDSNILDLGTLKSKNYILEPKVIKASTLAASKPLIIDEKPIMDYNQMKTLFDREIIPYLKKRVEPLNQECHRQWTTGLDDRVFLE